MCKFMNNAEHSRIDKCMKSLITYLKVYNLPIVACCCGHGHYPMTIVCNFDGEIKDIVSNKIIPRTRKFYKKDKNGYYLIPETVDKLKEKRKSIKYKQEDINEDQAGARDISVYTNAARTG